MKLAVTIVLAAISAVVSAAPVEVDKRVRCCSTMNWRSAQTLSPPSSLSIQFLPLLQIYGTESLLQTNGYVSIELISFANNSPRGTGKIDTDGAVTGGAVVWIKRVSQHQ